MDLELQGKNVLITGGSRGIGRAIATSLIREGARVFLTARGREDLNATAAALRAEGGTVEVLVCDVATPEGAYAAVAGAEAALGPLDGLVNNVGGSQGSGSFDVASASDWQRVIDTNLMSTVWCSQHAVERMKGREQGGVIVHVNSICGLEYCSSAPYTAAKAALTGLTREMAVDLARHRIRVAGVAPGSILFPGGSWDRRQQQDPERIAKMVQEQLPWGRFGTPEEVADVVTFLLSTRARWISGDTVVVDGAQARMF
ncbi:MAG TPA: SDR family oxidoreductase [Myxococcaceae bacterium]|nr:SDR family oxidoreductase [Myxococcaceae bacterium]